MRYLIRLRRDDFFYYDYAGGTYYAVKLCWFFDCPEDLEALIFTDGNIIRWHIHTKDCHGYLAEIPTTKELLDYFQTQRRWSDKYRACKDKKERLAVRSDYLTKYDTCSEY